VAAAEHDFKRQAWLPVDHFKRLLEVTCPNHTYPVKHKLKECTMMKNYMTMRSLAKSKKHEADLAGKATAPFQKRRQSCRFMANRTPMSHAASSSSPAGRSTP
jgi:hypothetical protein